MPSRGPVAYNGIEQSGRNSSFGSTSLTIRTQSRSYFAYLLDLSVENYIAQTPIKIVKDTDTLARRALRIAEDLHSKGKIDKKYLGVFKKFGQLDPLVSVDTLNRYVHSPNFAPSPEQLAALWDILADFIVHCLNA